MQSFDDHGEQQRRSDTRPLSGFCIMQLDMDGLGLACNGAELPAWREWQHVEAYQSHTQALDHVPASHVVVEVHCFDRVEARDDHWNVARAMPQRIWAVAGDDMFDAREVATAYGLEWAGLLTKERCPSEVRAQVRHLRKGLLDQWASDQPYYKPQPFSALTWATILAAGALMLTALMLVAGYPAPV